MDERFWKPLVGSQKNHIVELILQYWNLFYSKSLTVVKAKNEGSKILFIQIT
jgi:hypothetical protein